MAWRFSIHFHLYYFPIYAQINQSAGGLQFKRLRIIHLTGTRVFSSMRAKTFGRVKTQVKSKSLHFDGSHVIL